MSIHRPAPVTWRDVTEGRKSVHVDGTDVNYPYPENNELFFTIRQGISPDGPFCPICLSDPDYDGGHPTRAGKMA